MVMGLDRVDADDEEMIVYYIPPESHYDRIELVCTVYSLIYPIWNQSCVWIREENQFKCTYLEPSSKIFLIFGTIKKEFNTAINVLNNKTS